MVDLEVAGAGTPEAEPRGPRRRWSRRRRILVVALVVVLGLATAGFAGAAYFYDSVRVPDQIALDQATTLYYADGKTVLARVGTNRTLVNVADLPRYVTAAVMAAEDPTFETDTRAGGITYQYMRLATGMDDESTKTRLSHYVAAQKFDDRFSKDEIMEFYLNTVYFGRGAYGIEAAAKAFFGPNRPAKSLRLEEAMVLAGVIKSPGDGAFDPAVNPGPAHERWVAIRDELVDMGQIDSATAAAMTYPVNMVKYNPKVPPVNDMSRPTGLVVAQVFSELRQTPYFKDMSWAQIANGGFSIVTTLDTSIQKALEDAAGTAATGSVMRGQPKNLQAAGVVVQPGTGRVLAYYGGADGAGADFAGWYYDENGQPTGFGAHPAASTFFVYDLAAALKAGVSVRSQWRATSPIAFSSRPKDHPIVNYTRASCQPVCDLVESMKAQLNTPFYGLAEMIGPTNVIDMARAAGIRDMWANQTGQPGPGRIDLREQTALDVVPKYFDAAVALGSHPVTVVDQANAMATFAANGLRAEAHFVAKVTNKHAPAADRVLLSEKVPTGSEPPILNKAAIADLTWALSQNRPARLASGPDSAGMTGTFYYGAKAAESADAWMVGYTRKLAMAVWVGNKGKAQPLRDRTGDQIFGAGLPASIYRAVMTAASVGAPGEAFAPPVFAGDPKAGNAN